MVEKLRKEYVGQILTIEELANKLPNLWVTVKIVDTDPQDERIVRSGEILEIVLDNEAFQLRDKYYEDKSVRVMRTTYGMTSGIVDGICVKAC